MEIAPAAVRHQGLVRLLVARVFRDAYTPGYDYEDLVQEGLLAIIKAEPSYAPERGAETTFYTRAAINWINWRIVHRAYHQRTRANLRPVELDKPIEYNRGGAPGEYTLMETLVDPRAEYTGRIAAQIDASIAMERLEAYKPQWAQAVRLYYLGGLEMRDVGAEMGVSYQRVQQIIGHALRWMRNDAKQAEAQGA